MIDCLVVYLLILVEFGVFDLLVSKVHVVSSLDFDKVLLV